MATCNVCPNRARHECTHCGIKFCSHACSDAVATEHEAICFDMSNTDPGYVRSQLEEVILDMQQEPDVYDADEIEDAIGVLADLPESLDEARIIISDHLADEEGQEAFDSLPESAQWAIVGDQYGDYATFHLAHLAWNRIGDQEKDDRAAAKRALQAAELERRAAALRAKGQGITDAAQRRAERARQRGVRRQLRLQKRAQRQEARAARLQARAAKRKARGEMQKARAERRAGRVERFGAWRRGVLERAAKRKEAAAEKKRGQAKEKLETEEKEEDNELVNYEYIAGDETADDKSTENMSYNEMMAELKTLDAKSVLDPDEQDRLKTLDNAVTKLIKYIVTLNKHPNTDTWLAQNKYKSTRDVPYKEVLKQFANKDKGTGKPLQEHDWNVRFRRMTIDQLKAEIAYAKEHRDHPRAEKRIRDGTRALTEAQDIIKTYWKNQSAWDAMLMQNGTTSNKGKSLDKIEIGILRVIQKSLSEIAATGGIKVPPSGWKRKVETMTFRELLRAERTMPGRMSEWHATERLAEIKDAIRAIKQMYKLLPFGTEIELDDATITMLKTKLGF